MRIFSGNLSSQIAALDDGVYLDSINVTHLVKRKIVTAVCFLRSILYVYFFSMTNRRLPWISIL